MRKNIVTLLVALALAGCAAGSPYTKVYLTDQTGANARCVLTNDAGEWHMVTPGYVTVRNSEKPLAISCKAPGRDVRYALAAPYANQHFVAQ